jgi:hypothetical protein
VITDRPEQARAAVHRIFGANDSLPSYRRVMEREGVGGVAELALIGDESAVGEQLFRLSEIGVHEFAANIVAAGDDRERTWKFLSREALKR